MCRSVPSTARILISSGNCADSLCAKDLNRSSNASGLSLFLCWIKAEDDGVSGEKWNISSISLANAPLPKLTIPESNRSIGSFRFRVKSVPGWTQYLCGDDAIFWISEKRILFTCFGFMCSLLSTKCVHFISRAAFAALWDFAAKAAAHFKLNVKCFYKKDPCIHFGYRSLLCHLNLMTLT